MNSMQNNNFWRSSKLNNATFQDYLYRLKKIALSMFVWENLPESCNQRWLELCLFYFGKASFLYDKNLGYINTQAVPSGELNLYGLPTSINCWSYTYNTMRSLYTGLNNKEKDEECILIMNNWDMIPTESTLYLFAKRLYNAERTIDVNLNSSKYPVIILCDENQRLTMKNLFMKLEGNEPFIFGEKDLLKGQNGSQVQVLDMKYTWNIDKIYEYKRNIMNEALTFLGINNLMEDKKERLISDEANSNNELINLNLETFLIPRQEACEQINKKYGLNVKVKVRSDLENIIKQELSEFSDLLSEKNEENLPENKEGEENE